MNYQVKVNGEPAAVFTETVFPKPYHHTQKMECVSFLMEERAEVEITSAVPVQSVVIRPLSRQTAYTLEDGKIKIILDRPQKFSVEINGSSENNLIVFAEADRYRDFNPAGAGVLYFKKGVHKQNIFSIRESNTVVYLEEGAVLNGKMLVEDCENVTICGYGKITMEGIDRDVMPMERQRALELYRCKNVTVRDILITDSANWSFRMMGCDGVTVDNVKIIGCRGNSDGIDVCGSKNVTVSGIFTRTWDDSFVVKALDTGDVENILFRDSVLWNDFARPIEVGVELRADHVRNVTFEDIDIIHSPTGYPLLGIHHGDRAKVRGITFRDIRIEDTPGAQLFDIRITNSVWNRDGKMGDIADILFQNISYIGKPGMEFALSKSRIQGYSSEHSIKNVVLDNICLLGKAAASNEECGVVVMDYVENVQYRCPPDAPRIHPILTKMTITEELKAGQDGKCRGQVCVRAENPSEETQEGRLWLQISPVNTAVAEGGDFSYRIPGGSAVEKRYDVTLPPGKYVLSVQSDGVDVNGDWMLLELNCPVKRNAKPEQSPAYAFHNYYGDAAPEIRFGVTEHKLWVQSDILKNENGSIVLYAAMPVPEEDGEVKFSVEETDFGEVPAVLLGRHGLELAPQLRCPAEITYVFKNEPKVKEIRKLELRGTAGYAEVPLKALGVSGDHFWLEIQAKLPAVAGYRYPFTLFHSVKPADMAHMFGDIVIQ